MENGDFREYENMKKSANYVSLTAALCLLACLCCSGCTRTVKTTAASEVQAVRAESPREIPGVVEYVWEEPMVDTIDVPPGLDPEGHYYRPAHQSVVEIRQGRWRYYRQPGN